MWPSVAGSGSFEARADTAKGPKDPNARERVLLSFGDESPTVAALQRELKIDDDGIFGPLTEAAVRAFQKRAGMRPTGEVDVRTWLALFPNDAVVAAAGSPGGGVMPGARVNFGGDDGASAGTAARPAASRPAASRPASAPFGSSSTGVVEVPEPPDFACVSVIN
jgi:peptidoglycan hydrolase-like protein with peptidoglycan-binding domain